MAFQHLPHVIESATRLGHNPSRGEFKSTRQNPNLSGNIEYVAELNRFGERQRRPPCRF